MTRKRKQEEFDFVEKYNKEHYDGKDIIMFRVDLVREKFKIEKGYKYKNIYGDYRIRLFDDIYGLPKILYVDQDVVYHNSIWYYVDKNTNIEALAEKAKRKFLNYWLDTQPIAEAMRRKEILESL